MERIQTRAARATATFFGVGYCPFASGTAGSLAALPFAFVLTFFGGFPAMLAFFVFAYVAGTFASKEILKHPPKGYAGKHDPSIIVIDEVAGQFVPLTFFSIYFSHSAIATAPETVYGDWWLYVALPSFILFRIFDITKPFPASYFDKKVLNANGVMLDDIVAGLYALLVMAAVKFIY